jgi:hypothetical protein
MSPASTKKTSYAFTILIKSLSSPWSLPGTLEEGKNHNSPKTCRDPKFPPNLCLINLLSTTGKPFEKLNLRRIQKHTEERNLLYRVFHDFRA